jgi:hypothetical protein
MTYLLVNVYAAGSELNLSDQITVPLTVWEAMTASGSSSGPCIPRTEVAGPCFVEVTENSGVFGRIVPGSTTTVEGDTCQLPQWMVDRLGVEEEGTWVLLSKCALQKAGVVTLRAREEATLTEVDDPVTMLSEIMSASWACLSVGSALPLICGTFDVIGIEGTDGSSMSGACILDTDVIMELIPALDHADTPTPSSAASSSASASASAALGNKETGVEAAENTSMITTSMFPLLQEHRQQQHQQNQQNQQNQQTQNKFQRRRSEVGFSPFQGVGRRTCDP